MRHTATRRNERGHTLVELLVAIGVLGLVTAGVFGQLNTAAQRIYTEQIKVDNFDQARDFVDQFFRDINQIGYPNVTDPKTHQQIQTSFEGEVSLNNCSLAANGFNPMSCQ